MAKITLEISDNVDGTICVKCTPPMHEMKARLLAKEGLSGAHMMAIEACIAMRNLSRGYVNGKDKSRLILPDGL